MSLIYMKIKIYFHINGIALSLALKQRLWATLLPCPIGRVIVVRLSKTRIRGNRMVFDVGTARCG